MVLCRDGSCPTLPGGAPGSGPPVGRGYRGAPSPSCGRPPPRRALFVPACPRYEQPLGNSHLQGRAGGVRAAVREPEIPHERLLWRGFPHRWFCSKQQGGSTQGGLQTATGHQPGGGFVRGQWPCDPAPGHLGCQLPGVENRRSRRVGAELCSCPGDVQLRSPGVGPPRQVPGLAQLSPEPAPQTETTSLGTCLVVLHLPPDAPGLQSRTEPPSCTACHH